MNILNYLREVLLFSKKVTLPGFGTFRIEKTHAILSGKKISPPQSKLIFDSSASIDDEVLSSQISNAEDLSLEEAKQIVLEFIDEIRFSLDKGEKYNISGLCEISRDANNIIKIEKDPDLILDFDNFGMDSFELDDFEGELEEELEERELLKKEKLSSDLPDKKKTEKEVNPRAEVQEIAQPKPYIKKNNRSTVWFVVGAVVVMAAVIIIIPFKTNLFENEIDFDSFFGNRELVIDDDFSEADEGEFSFESLVEELEKGLDSVTSMEHALIPDVDLPNEEAVIHKAEFHIIAGSFKDSRNAEELQKTLIFEGYPALTLDLGNGIYRVSVISFTDKNKALNALIAFRENMDMSGAWLMTLE